MIFVQDMKGRAVYWFLFPLLACLFILLRLQVSPFDRIVGSLWPNIIFVSVMLIFLSAYISVKHKKFINITKDMLGWGDILFWFAICFYLSPFNYILFYIVSLIIVLLIWIVTLFFNKKNVFIPLAGLQAIIFIVCLMTDRFSPRIDLTSDNWLLHCLYEFY